MPAINLLFDWHVIACLVLSLLACLCSLLLLKPIRDAGACLAFKLVLRPLGRNLLAVQQCWHQIRGHDCPVMYANVGVKDATGGAHWRPTPPKQLHGSVRCVCISDTHLLHRSLKLPDGDVLIHCGDVLLNSRSADAESLASITEFNSWLADQTHLHKLVVAGNHDGALAAVGKDQARHLLNSCIYLQDEVVEVSGLQFYGSPLSTGTSANAAFQQHGGYDITEAVSKIPRGLDVLITHGPAGDAGTSLGRASSSLTERRLIVAPRVHVFGHYHLGHGVCRTPEGILVVNASSADALFAVTNPPIVLDIALH